MSLLTVFNFLIGVNLTLDRQSTSFVNFLLPFLWFYESLGIGIDAVPKDVQYWWGRHKTREKRNFLVYRWEKGGQDVLVQKSWSQTTWFLYTIVSLDRTWSVKIGVKGGFSYTGRTCTRKS